MGFGDSLSSFFGVGSGDPGNPYRNALQANAQQLGNYGQQLGGYGQQWANAYNANQAGLNNTIGMLQQQATGQNSYSAEQLRQSLQQNLASQQSMAAAASPNNAAMAARNAAMNMGRAAYGLSGQQALAGIQERNAAVNSLGGLQQAQAQMNMQGALNAYGAANNAYGTANQGLGTNLQNPQKSWWGDVVAPVLGGAMNAFGGGLGGMGGQAMNANNPSQFWQNSGQHTGSLYPGGY